jgi:chromosome segregation ATPase
MEQPAKVGRKGIDESLYSEQITKWLNDGLSLDDISATSLQKAVGGQYKKAVSALDRFKEAYEAKALADVPPIPQAVTEELTAYAAKLWREVNQATHDKIAEVQAAAQAEVDAATARHAESLNMIESLETDLEKAEENNADLVQSMKATESRLVAKSESAAALQSDKHHLAQQLDSLRNELEQARTENKAIETARQSLSEQLGIERASTQSLTEQVKEARQRIESLTGDLAQCRQDSEATKARLDQEAANSRELAERLQAAQSELAQERADHRRAKSDYTTCLAAASKNAEQVTSLTEQCATLKADMGSLAATNEQYKERYQAAEKTAAGLQKDLLALAKKQK